MSSRTTLQCPRREVSEALANDELSGKECLAAQSHLEECESCRTFFRQQTQTCFPRFRNYTIVERMGEGGFGVVYKVIHHAKERTEALKVLFGKTPVRAAYFMNEVRLIAKLQHPNIATLYEAHLNSPPLYYTMEFVEGEQLDDYFHSHHTRLAERIRVLKMVVEAIGYAHEHGVVHRDLKPQNILINAQGQPRIVDFGIAKRFGLHEIEEDEPISSPEGFMGTFGYVAPEQAAGESVDARADIYALGALLYHCLTGEPAKFANRADRLTQMLHERRITRADDLAAIIAHCVAPLPEQRYSTCTALAEDLDRYLAGRPIRARQHPSPGYRAVRGAALLLRTQPLLVRMFIAITVASLLTFESWWAEALWYLPSTDLPSTMLIAFTPETKEAIRMGTFDDIPGLNVSNWKSWRMLYGRRMERLAEAEPLVVVWDYYFPDCRPEFDQALIQGMEALRGARVPVVVGVRDFDINSEPLACQSILAAAHGHGTLAAAKPADRMIEFIVPACIQIGFARPVPGLAVAGLAAARHPGAELDLEINANIATLRYRKRDIRGGESRWHEEVHQIRCAETHTQTKSELLRSDDLFLPIHIRGTASTAKAVPRVAFHNVLKADREQLRRWFQGRAIIVGKTIPLLDQYQTMGARGAVFGCEVHALALEALLSGTYAARFERQKLMATIFLWAAVAAILAGLIPCSNRLSLRTTAWLCLLGFLAGVVLIFFGAILATDFWQVQLTLALSLLLAAGSPAYFAKTVRERQIQLAPELTWEPEEGTIATTLLATENDSDTSSIQDKVVTHRPFSPADGVKDSASAGSVDRHT